MRTAVVTGAGRGIGLAIARLLSAQGWAVLLTTRDEVAGKEAALASGGSAWSTVLDVRDTDDHHRVAAEASARGPLELWVNNAGVLATGPGWEQSAETVALQVTTNVLGTIAGCTAALAAMGTGDILNVASLAGLGPVPGMGVYAATKAAVISYSTSLQGDLDRAGRTVRVHALCPDAVSTAMVLERSTDPDAAVLFSGRHLTAEAVALAGVAMLGRRQVVRLLPRTRGSMARAGGLLPSVALAPIGVFARRGARRQTQL